MTVTSSTLKPVAIADVVGKCFVFNVCSRVPLLQSNPCYRAIVAGRRVEPKLDSSNASLIAKIVAIHAIHS